MTFFHYWPRQRSRIEFTNPLMTKTIKHKIYEIISFTLVIRQGTTVISDP